MAHTGSKSLGNGFTDHGVASPRSNARGIVATVDGDGRDVALVWLFDHRGGYALLMIDALTGKTDEIPMPFDPGHDCPFASILSSRNRFYTHFNSHFAEFDPVQRKFTFHGKTVPNMAMGMTEDDRGRIWAATYPNSGVVCFDPATREMRDYGHVHKENWAQYQRSVAADDRGWVYFAVGNTASQIIMFDPDTGKATPILPENERGTGSAYVFRDLDGKVYGQPLHGKEGPWYELHGGVARRIDRPPQARPKPIVTSSQGLFHKTFPSGRQLEKVDLIDFLIASRDPRTGETIERPFTYTSDGAHLMGVAAAPNGVIAGGTAFPMRFFTYDPRTDQWTNRHDLGQSNTVVTQGDRFFIGGYIHGYLLEWDPARPWVKTEKGNPDCNPRHLTECEPTINRPHKLLAHPDGNTIILVGTPGYGYTGGGMLIWDRAAQAATLLKHTDLLPQHSVICLVVLPDGNILGATTTDAGTGGERKVDESEFFLFDLPTRRVLWRAAVHKGVAGYNDMCLADNGIVYGFADGHRYFAYDPRTRASLVDEKLDEKFGSISYQQGQRKLVTAPDGAVYALLRKSIARVNKSTHRLELVAESPVGIHAGGDYLDGRLYFASASHLCSYTLPVNRGG